MTTNVNADIWRTSTYETLTFIYQQFTKYEGVNVR